MEAGKKVWAPNLTEGFILGEVTDFSTETIFVQPMDGSKVQRREGAKGVYEFPISLRILGAPHPGDVH